MMYITFTGKITVHITMYKEKMYQDLILYFMIRKKKIQPISAMKYQTFSLSNMLMTRNLKKDKLSSC